MILMRRIREAVENIRRHVKKISELTNLKFESRFKQYNGEYGFNPWRIREFSKNSLNLIKSDKDLRCKDFSRFGKKSPR